MTDIFFLQKLLPVGALVWFPMNETHPNGDGAGVVFDRSGNMRNLAQASNAPVYQAITTRGITRNNVYFDGAANPLQRDFGASPLAVKHLFTLARHDGANFGSEYRGLVSGMDNSNYPVLLGETSATRFYNLGYSSVGTYQYKKSQIPYPENNQLAPFAKTELLEVSFSGGFILDGLQIGQDRENENKRWIGTWGDTVAYGRVLSAAEVAAVNLYYDLKFGLWKKNNTVLNFPSPNIAGILYSRFFADVPDYKKITNSHEYEDGGKSFNESSDYAPRSWEVEFNFNKYSHSESKSYTDIFDEFYKQARFANAFNFTDKYGETHTGVRIEDYNRSHSAHKSWSQNCRFKLVKLP